jgi:L-2-hydroxycarboxylate dehydrogenase (NAD+)
MRELLIAVGCEPTTAELAAEFFWEADLRGVGLQGLDHMHTMIRAIRMGHIDPKGKPRITKEGPAFALIDGGRGPGQLAALLAIETVITKARSAGTCGVGITNSSDIFMLGLYAERIARAGLVGFVFTGAPPQVHPFGGVEPLLGTNPLAIAFPTENGDPVVIDMATSALSGSRIRQAWYFGEEVAEGIAVDAKGAPTTNPGEIRSGGAIATMAGHKGFALSLAVALLSGPLVGASTGDQLRGWTSDARGPQAARGHLLLAINPTCFGDTAAFSAATTAYVNTLKQSRKAAGSSAIRIPGERGFEARRRSLQEGVLIYEVVWERAATLARKLGVSVPVVLTGVRPNNRSSYQGSS